MSLNGASLKKGPRFFSISISAGLVAGFIIPVMVLSGSWFPFEHTTCALGNEVYDSGPLQLPAVLLNSPFGGDVLGTGTVTAFGLPGWTESIRTSDTNGGADWAGFGENITVFSL